MLSLEKNHDLVIVSKDVIIFIPDPLKTIFPSCQATILSWMRINHARDLHDKYYQSSQPKSHKNNKQKNISLFFQQGSPFLELAASFSGFCGLKGEVDVKIHVLDLKVTQLTR